MLQDLERPMMFINQKFSACPLSWHSFCHAGQFWSTFLVYCVTSTPSSCCQSRSAWPPSLYPTFCEWQSAPSRRQHRLEGSASAVPQHFSISKQTHVYFNYFVPVSLFLKFVLCICVGYAHVCAGALGVQRCWMPWNWSYRWL